jgi:hypothetical protein
MWQLLLICFCLFIALSHQNVDYPNYPAIYAMDEWVSLSEHDMTAVLGDVKPIPPVGRADKDTLIYVGLVTYRDARCVTTIQNLFKKAKNPDRVRIGKFGLPEIVVPHSDFLILFFRYCSTASYRRRSLRLYQ